MSIYTTIYLEPTNVEYERYTDEHGVKRVRKKGILHITSFQNFRSLDDLICSVPGVTPAPNPYYDPDKKDDTLSLDGRKHRGYYLGKDALDAIASTLIPIAAYLRGMDPNKRDSLEEGDDYALEALFGSKAKARKAKLEYDAKMYGTPFYLACDSFLTSKIIKAADAIAFLHRSELPIEGTENAEGAETVYRVYYRCE